jgi:magnesium-transporting ATPase (P-type)
MRTPKTSLHHPSHALPRQQHFRLERWHRWSLYAVLAGLTISGAVWLIARYFLRQASEFGESLHPWEHPAIQVHGALAMLCLFLLGALLQLHMRRAHRAQRNRATGWSMVALFSTLCVSAYGLYYLADEQTRGWWSAAHWIIGLGLPLLLILHILIGRKTIHNF